LNQSSGAVFSPLTAAEIRRRSEVLTPVMQPDWRLLTQIQQKARGRPLQDLTTPLTADSLVKICSDERLGFVVAAEKLGFGALSHARPGAWHDWNLYDCRRVRTPDAGR
jgi:hypothetical protein